VTLPLGDNLEVDYALVNTSNLQGMSGTHYHDNDFGGDKYAIVVTGGIRASSLTQWILQDYVPNHHPPPPFPYLRF
jgi:hypothetical protein